MLTVLRDIVYFMGIIGLTFVTLSVLTLIDNLVLALLLSVLLLCAIIIASAKFLEWVITR